MRKTLHVIVLKKSKYNDCDILHTGDDIVKKNN